MKKFIVFSRFLLASISVLIAADAAESSMASLEGLSEKAQTINIAQREEIQYETYDNSRFDFSIRYPSNLLMPQSPPTNSDGREFNSPMKDIRMIVYGQHQVDQSLEDFYENLLQFHSQRDSEIIYTVLGDEEFIISGYGPTGNVFYQKTLLHRENFLILGLIYDRALHPEFDSIVAEISTSFQATGDRTVD